MHIRDYADFVIKSDATHDKPHADRERIAQYGIASEIGSLISAIKKKEIFTNLSWNQPNDEIIEELGDIIWYTAMLAGLGLDTSILDAMIENLSSLPARIEEDSTFKETLPRGNYEKFLLLSSEFLESESEHTFGEYQQIAFLTARTEGKELHHVCLTRLFLYATVMMSHGFPDVEKHLQKDIIKLELNDALGMVMWHLAALATIYGVSLDQIADANREKLNELSNIEACSPTPLYDDGDEVPPTQRFPREFEVAFVSVAEDRLQMYFEGAPLGDELTDNSRERDGYRFHDVMHLANAAKLGWSPVLRKVMGRKRKFSSELDRVEDGARAIFAEEAVVKAIHSEGAKTGATGTKHDSFCDVQLFTDKNQISFSFLKLMKRFVKGLEVEKSKYWEWQEAIVEAHKIYAHLCREKQGTVSVSLIERTISFEPDVYLDISGVVVSTGSATVAWATGDANLLSDRERKLAGGDALRLGLASAQKCAVLNALGVDAADPRHAAQLEVMSHGEGRLGFRAQDDIQKEIWRRKIVSFRSLDTITHDLIVSHVMALTNPSHLK